MRKEKNFFKKYNLKFLLLLAFTSIFSSTISLADVTMGKSGSLAGFEKFSTYIMTLLTYSKWVAGIFGATLLIYGFIEFMADNTQVTRLITRLIVCIFCLGLAFGVDKVIKSLGGATIDMNKYQIEKIEKLEKMNKNFKMPKTKNMQYWNRYCIRKEIKNGSSKD